MIAAILLSALPAVSVQDVLPARAELSTGPSTAWVDYDQDNYGPGKDDGYTAGIRAGVEASSWTITASWLMFTDRDAGLRSDEGSVQVLRSWSADRLRLAAGGGLVFAGDLGGDDVQTWWHHTMGDPEYDLRYEDRYWSPSVAGTVEYVLFRDVAPADTFEPTYCDLVARGGAIAHLRELRLQAGVELVYGVVQRSRISIQPLIEWTVGEGSSQSARVDQRLNPGALGCVYLGPVHVGMFGSLDRFYGTIGVRF